MLPMAGAASRQEGAPSPEKRDGTEREEVRKSGGKEGRDKRQEIEERNFYFIFFAWQAGLLARMLRDLRNRLWALLEDEGLRDFSHQPAASRPAGWLACWLARMLTDFRNRLVGVIDG